MTKPVNEFRAKPLLGVRLSTSQLDLLRELSASTGLTRSEIARRMLQHAAADPVFVAALAAVPAP